MGKPVIKPNPRVTQVFDDLERYLEDPSDFRSEYFEDVCTAARMAEEILKNEGGDK